MLVSAGRLLTVEVILRVILNVQYWLLMLSAPLAALSKGGQALCDPAGKALTLRPHMVATEMRRMGFYRWLERCGRTRASCSITRLLTTTS